MAICNLMIILSVSACLVGNLRTPSVNAVVFVCICRVVPSLPSSFTSPQQTVEISTKNIWLLQIFCHSTQNIIKLEIKPCGLGSTIRDMAICSLMIILSVSVCLVGNLRTPSVNAVVFVCICRVVPSLPSSFTSPQQTVEISTKIIWLLQIFCHSTQNEMMSL